MHFNGRTRGHYQFAPSSVFPSNPEVVTVPVRRCPLPVEEFPNFTAYLAPLWPVIIPDTINHRLKLPLITNATAGAR
ncbi:hypothetical protein J6590_048649 [Homalodisca vitripennis]|nr:hypothetical protein J6590_048649 [Homalodisca vitripennis]